MAVTCVTDCNAILLILQMLPVCGLCSNSTCYSPILVYLAMLYELHRTSNDNMIVSDEFGRKRPSRVIKHVSSIWHVWKSWKISILESKTEKNGDAD